MKRLVLLALGMFLVGCGGDGGPGPRGTGGTVVVVVTGTGGTTQPPPPPLPTTHVIDQGGPLRRLPASTRSYIGPFTLPVGATVTYSIIDMPTGVGADTMDFVIANNSMASNGPAVQLSGYGVENNVNSVSTTTAALPAGTYDLFWTCANLIDECFFTDTISALY